MSERRQRRAAERSARKALRSESVERRRRARTRSRSQREPMPLSLESWARNPALRLGERPGHQASTAHVQAAYPAVAEAGLGAAGVYVGRDQHGGSFVYDPWVLYTRQYISDANTIVLGMLGYGKSALSKSYLWRQRVFNRTCEVIDIKGEYSPLIEAMGGVILALAPGGKTKLNPLTRVGPRELREALLEAVARAMLARPLRQVEAVGLTAALEAADRGHDGEVTIPDVIAKLSEPDAELAGELMVSAGQARDELRECALALKRLCNGPLRGMFDAPTTASERVWDAPAVALDFSALRAGTSGSNLALGITMICASAFLDAKRQERAERAKDAGLEAAKVIRVNDEAWRALPIAGLGEYYQEAFKMSRKTGVQHWIVLHRLSDLRAAGDEGSRQQRLAEGLLAETSTTITYRQHTREADYTGELAGLSSTEITRIPRLEHGEALWRVGGRSFLVYHVISDAERPLVETDSAMVEPEHEGAM